MTDLPEGIAAIAEKVSGQELSATEITATHLERAEDSQPTLNAFTMIDHDGAVATAAAVDARIANGERVGPLAGVPIAIKDLIDHAGRPNTAGSSLPPSVPETSATVVARLEEAGAIVIGRTGLHEYAFGFSSENHWFGPVRNPWNTALSPGGSSGGSGAAVAAGIVPGALGTDTGGSVRVPAALCGIVGLKVTHGRIPLTGVFPLAPSLDTVGPLAGSVADATLIYLAMAGPDPSDPWSSPRPVQEPDIPTDLSKATLGIPHPWVDLSQTEAVSASFAAAVRELKNAGATLVDLHLPDLVPTKELEYSVYPEVAVIHHDRWHQQPESYGPDVSHRLGEVFDVDPLAYVKAQEWRSRLRHTAEAALAECDFLLTPAVATAVKPIGKEMIQVGGKLNSYRPALSRFSALVNHIGLPAMVLPLDMDSIPPPSLQIIGRAWNEHRLLEMGVALERLGISRRRLPPHTFS